MANNTSDDELTLEDTIAFLCGEKSLSGRWYGEKYEGEPAFWWRPKLRQLIKQREEQVRIEEKDFWQSYVDVDYVECNGFKCRLPWCGSCNGEDEAERKAAEAKLEISIHVEQLTTTHKGDLRG